ncbi:endo alpha-1,4 polygalactosaminidase [Micromonospora sp. NBC_00858]|uniref:endo alpha-1,4 polygalactosaminidase n=1 Tax=Micromonospora sp. NBC_00858 TaxID=2975979 RepID=UPI00386FCC04|nr:endo alpha-1,4 polygalactosaminidase [Micromonospora sp. NBC_00858]
MVLPPTNGSFDYQIGGAYEPDVGVTIVERDHSGVPSGAAYNICYVNAFQTQPEAAAWWKAEHRDLLLKAADGSYVEDPEWPGEILLDTTTPARRTAIAGVVQGWMDECAAKGFRAVEPDNLDSWTRSGDRLTHDHNMALARLLVEHAHDAGLAVAQKNTPELAPYGRDQIGFDFAVVEECQHHDECQSYTDAYGDHLIEIEYTDNPVGAYLRACATRGARISVILRDRDVVPLGRQGYHYERC